MPGSFGYIDTNFPTFTGGESADEKVATIQQYLYMLLEELRYTLRNLDIAKNFNDTSVRRFTEVITEPLYASLSSAEGKISELTLTAEGLKTRVADAEGNISLVSQTASKIEWVVSGSSYSSFTLTSRAASLVASSIDLTGFVTFSSLSSAGQTTINGGNVTAGTITGATLRSIVQGQKQVWIRNGGVDIMNGAGTLMGGLYYDDTGAGTLEENRYRVFLHSRAGVALKIESGGNMSIESVGGTVYAMGHWDFSGASVDW